MAVGPKMKRGNGRPFPLETPIERERLFGGHLGRSGRRRREHVHLDLAARPLAERDDAVDGGEEGVVAADADILAGGIATFARGAACFFVCHRTAPVALLGDDLFDLDHRQVLTVTILAPRVLATALLED